MIAPMKAARKGRKFHEMDRSRRDGSSLSIDMMLERSKETGVVEARKRTIEKLGLTEWKIWKLLHIEWE
jgi:hypothetical protein